MSEQPSVEALVERVREGLTLTEPLAPAYRMDYLAALDSLTAALERAERERDERFSGQVQANRRARLAEARAQKAEAVVRHAPTPEYVSQWGVSAYQKWYDGTRRAALTAYDEPPTEQA